MNTSRLSALGLGFALLLATSAASAGPVSFQAGNVAVTYFDDTTNGSDTRTFPVAFPGSDDVHYHGTPDPAFPDFGNNRGDSGATYTLADHTDGAKFDVTVFTQNNGSEQHTGGGESGFALTFTTDRPLHLVFNVDPLNRSETRFEAKLDDLTENIASDVFGTTSGTLLNEGAPVAKTDEGTLPAGAHSLSLLVNALNGRENEGAGKGMATLTLSDEGGGGPPPPGIPLPPALCSGSITLAGLAALRALAPILRAGRQA